MSDPTTCASPQGPYSHIYVTVTDVRIHQSATASASDSGWVDLTPNLMSNPVQVDLLGAANQCFLGKLGSNGIPPGAYQQIRILLAASIMGMSSNKCGSSANSVMLTSDPTNTPETLQLSSETQTASRFLPASWRAASSLSLLATIKISTWISMRASRSCRRGTGSTASNRCCTPAK